MARALFTWFAVKYSIFNINLEQSIEAAAKFVGVQCILRNMAENSNRTDADGGGGDPSPDGEDYRLRIFLNREIKQAIHGHVDELRAVSTIAEHDVNNISYLIKIYSHLEPNSLRLYWKPATYPAMGNSMV